MYVRLQTGRLRVKQLCLVRGVTIPARRLRVTLGIRGASSATWGRRSISIHRRLAIKTGCYRPHRVCSRIVGLTGPVCKAIPRPRTRFSTSRVTSAKSRLLQPAIIASWVVHSMQPPKMARRVTSRSTRSTKPTNSSIRASGAASRATRAERPFVDPAFSLKNQCSKDRWFIPAIFARPLVLDARRAVRRNCREMRSSTH